MREKSTGDLSQELMAQANLDQYIADNQPFFSDGSVAAALAELYQGTGLTKADLARRAGMSEVYLHQVFSGRRRPSRDRLLCICIGMELGLEQVQKLLKQVGYPPIYPRHKRDAIISHGVIHHTPLAVINDKLFVENERTLY